MKKQVQSIILKCAVVAGFFCFFFHLKKVSVPLAVAVIMLLAVAVSDRVYGRNHWSVLTPFLSGFLLFLSRFFYWDRIDWTQRVENLLIISIVFAFLMAGSRFRLARKALFLFKRLGFRKRLAAIFIFSEILFVLAGWVMVEKGVELVGDEAHYLVVSQSIARDFDLNVFNQYAREEYRAFYPRHLPSHAKVGKGFKRWYSFHLPGLSVTLVPFMLLGLSGTLLFFLVRIYLGLFAALLAVLVYLFARKIWRREALALLVTAVFCFTSPVFFHSIHVFPEVQVLLLLLSCLYLLLFKRKKSRFSVLWAGLLLSVTVFWGMKYVIFIAGLAIGFLVYFLVKGETRSALLFILFPLFFQLVFFGYLYFAYGNLSPMSVYTGVMSDQQASQYHRNIRNIPFENRFETLLDYFFDQRDGLLLYNPFYFFFFPGLILAVKKWKSHGPFLLVSSVSFVYLIYHAYSTVRAGVCPQGRYLVPIMWTVMLFAVVYYRESRNRFFRKLFWRIPLVSCFIVVYQVFNPFTLYQTTTHDYLYRSGLLFQKWGNIHINVAQWLPSFIKTVPSAVPPYSKPSANLAYLPNIVVLLLFLILVGISLIAFKFKKTGFLLPVAFVFCFVLFVLFPRPPLHNPVLVNRANTLPHLIHGVSHSPGKISRKMFKLHGAGDRRFLISTREKAECFVVESVNTGGEFISAGLYNFDRRFPNTRGFRPGSHRQTIKNPVCLRRRGRYYYQFTLKVTGDPSQENPVSIEFFPVKNCRLADFSG